MQVAIRHVDPTQLEDLPGRSIRDPVELHSSFFANFSYIGELGALSCGCSADENTIVNLWVNTPQSTEAHLYEAHISKYSAHLKPQRSETKAYGMNPLLEKTDMST